MSSTPEDASTEEDSDDAPPPGRPPIQEHPPSTDFGAPTYYGAPAAPPSGQPWTPPSGQPWTSPSGEPLVAQPVPLPASPRRRPLIAMLGVAALAGAAFTGTQAVSLYTSSHAPKAAAERYYEALQSGDAKAALGLADKPQTSPWLTAQVLRDQLKVAAITNVSTTTVKSAGAEAAVQVRYRLQFRNGAKDVTDQVALVRRGSVWRIVNPVGAVRIDAVGPGADRISLAGRPLVDQSVVMFPGALPVLSDSPLVVIDGEPSVPLGRSNQTLRIEPHLSDDGRRKMAQAVDAALNTCLSAAQPDLHCPTPLSSRVIPGTLRGTTTTKFAEGGASIDLASQGKGIVSFGGVLDVTGTWKAWDFNNQIVPGKGRLRMNVIARASLDDLGTIVWGAS